MPLALGISFRALCIDFIQKLSLNSCRETTKAAQMAEKRNAKRKAKKKSYSENWENWETAAIIWLIKDCMPKIANATGHRAIGWWRGVLW